MTKGRRPLTDTEVLCTLIQESIHDNQELLKDVRNLKIIMEVEAPNKTHYIELMKAKIKHWRAK